MPAERQQYHFPPELYYESQTRLWVRVEGETATIGLSALALETFGDIAYISTIKAGQPVERGQVIGSIEAAKMVDDLVAPISGEIIAFNEDVQRNPALINADPYGGWLVRIKPDEWERDSAESDIWPGAGTLDRRTAWEVGAMNEWRLITDDGVSASFGLAADECLAHRVGTGTSQPTLRLYTYRSHCALVGRFQNTDNEISRTYCEANGIPLNRRPTGGGAIIMGEDQLGIALCIPGREGDSYRQARELMVHFSAGIISGLEALWYPGSLLGQKRRRDQQPESGRAGGVPRSRRRVAVSCFGAGRS